jgi:hypothetical protein
MKCGCGCSKATKRHRNLKFESTKRKGKEKVSARIPISYPDKLIDPKSYERIYERKLVLKKKNPTTERDSV